MTDKETNALIDAAEEYAGVYHDDPRECITTDVMNAFFAGAAYQQGLTGASPARLTAVEKP